MILAIEAAGQDTTLQLIEPASHAVKTTDHWTSGRKLSDDLLTHITALLASQKQALNDLTAIIIFSGPGSFTSLRIGHTIANTLADSLAIPVIGAGGEDWLADGLAALATAKPGGIALPLYGAQPNITKPKH